MYLTFSAWTISLTKFIPKIQDFERVLDLIENKRRIEQFSFFNWLTNVRNLVYSNSSEHLRNVIPWH